MAYNTMYKVLNKPHNQPLEEILTIPKYQFAKYLGMNQMTVLSANEFNRYDKIPIDIQFNMINKIFGGKRIYIKYLKSDSQEDKKTLMISKYYKISIEKALEYQQMETKENLQKVYDTFKDIKYKDWTRGYSKTTVDRFAKL